MLTLTNNMDYSEKQNQNLSYQAINMSALQLLKSYNILIPPNNIGKQIKFNLISLVHLSISFNRTNKQFISKKHGTSFIN